MVETFRINLMMDVLTEITGKWPIAMHCGYWGLSPLAHEKLTPCYLWPLSSPFTATIFSKQGLDSVADYSFALPRAQYEATYVCFFFFFYRLSACLCLLHGTCRLQGI